MKKVNKGVYIKSIEASRIWDYMNRGQEVTVNDYVGMIPYSLELIQLRKQGLSELVKRRVEKDGKYITKYISPDERTLKNAVKVYTDDIINVKFNQSVKSIDKTISDINKSKKKRVRKKEAEYYKKIEIAKDENEIKVLQIELEKEKEKIEDNKLINHLKALSVENPENWNKRIDVSILRDELYKNGFKIEGIDYVVYKRSSAKARTGECLFIRKELFELMMKWSRLGLDIPEDKKIDLAALSAYESLVGSSIEGLIKINPKNILLIDDVESIFKRKVNVIQKAQDVEGNDILVSRVEENGEIKNSLFDGQGLLDSSYFVDDYAEKSMLLLRQHFFKSAVFNTNIQTFLENNLPEGETIESWTLRDMLGNPIQAKNVHLIITPSSLKVFKFSFLVGDENKMYKHWKKVVKAEGMLFGVVKTEKPTKRGYTVDGMPLQQMSYQMINSLPVNKEEVEQLCQFEVNYINEMKNDAEKFIKHLENTATFSNSNNMMVSLFRHNPDIAKTKFFNDFRITHIDEYKKKVKRGKIRVAGDYMVLLGNPYEMLLHSIKSLDLDNLTSQTLHNNEVYSPLFKEEELAGFRNPHTAANNILYVHNKHNKLIKTYFNLSKNIIAVNAIIFPIQDILSGCDYDSDTVLLTNNEIIVNKAKESSDTYDVCLNGVSAKPVSFKPLDINRSTVDKAIATDAIGLIVNIGQVAQSIYWDAIHNNKKETEKAMKEVVEIVSVLSTIAIDLAKRKYDIEIMDELERLQGIVNDYKKDGSYPLFTSVISNKKKVTTYDTAMDHLVKILCVSKDGKYKVKLERAEELKSEEMIEIWDLVRRCDENGEKFEISKANDKQEREIINLVNDYTTKVSAYNAEMKDKSSNAKQQYIKAICDESESMHKTLQKKSIKPNTIYSILYHAFYTKSIEKNVIKVLNATYLSQSKEFINIFIQKNSEINN